MTDPGGHRVFSMIFVKFVVRNTGCLSAFAIVAYVLLATNQYIKIADLTENILVLLEILLG